MRLKESDEAQENRRLKAELARIAEERDIFKKSAAYFARDTSEARVYQSAQVTV